MKRPLLALTILLTATALHADEPKKEPISGPGRVVAVRRATISSTVPGVISHVMVTEGQQVKKGDILFRLDSRARELDVKRGEIQLKTAMAKHEQLRVGVNEEARKVAQAEIAKAEAIFKGTESAFTRVKALHAKGSASAEEVARGEADLLAAKAELEKQKASLKALEAGAPRGEVAASELAVEAARLAFDLAKLALEATTILAPFDGVVYRLGVEPGTYTNPATTGLTNAATLCEIVDIAAPRIEATLPETAFFHLRVGKPCFVKVTTNPDKTFEGTIERISPIIEREGIAVRVKLAGDGAVPLGATARVELAPK